MPKSGYFWAYLRVLARAEADDLQQYKISLLRTYTQGRTTSLRATTRTELSRFLTDYKALFARKNARLWAMRHRVVYLFIEKGYCSGTWPEAEAQANKLCRRRFAKPLRQMRYEELPRIISVIEQRWRHKMPPNHGTACAKTQAEG